MTALFEVLAEAHRRSILDLLRESERSVTDLVGVLGVSQPAVSKHLRVLREAGAAGAPASRVRPSRSGLCGPALDLCGYCWPYRLLRILFFFFIGSDSN